MNAIEWKLDIIFLLLVGFGLCLWLQGKKITDAVSRLKELRKMARVMSSRQSATKL